MEFFSRHPHDGHPSVMQQCVSLSFLRAGIPESGQKCHYCAAGVSATYLGGREGMPTKKRGDNRKKERFSMYASLCGGGNVLKAPGSVASYF
jgi:hypothetical protein